MRRPHLLVAMWLAFAVYLGFGCASAGPKKRRDTRRATPQAAGQELVAQPRADVRIHITELPAVDRWTVRFELDEPAQQLVFVRKRNLFRAASWKVETPGYVWRQSGGHEVLSTAGTRAAEITVSFASDFGIKPKDYELNLAFSDGSRLLFAPHLAVVPCSDRACTTVLDEADDTTYSLHLHATAKRRLIAAGRTGLHSLVVPPLRRDEQSYVFFGEIAPVDEPSAVVVVDPGMPTWLVEQARKYVPKLMSHYRKELRVELTHRPTVFMSFGGATVGRQSNGGGVAAGVVQLAAEGARWQEASETNTHRWFRFVAHETFHLFNGDRFHAATRADEWLAEGAAELFAMNAAVSLGVATGPTRQAWLREAANRCLMEMDAGPLATAFERGGQADAYTCGALVLHAVEQALAESTSGPVTLSELFRDLFASRAKSGAESYTTRSLFDQIAHQPGAAARSEVMRTWVLVASPKEVDVTFLRLLERTEPVRLTRDIGDTLRRGHVVHALGTQLARCDCARGAFQASSTRITVGGDTTCDQLSTAIDVASVQGVSWRTHPTKAFFALIDARRARGDIEVTTVSGEKRTLHCHGSPPRFEKLLR